jgi:ABC-type amino acid transport substrate-binding protein
MQVVLERKLLRVNYFRDALPSVFRNKPGKLVGFDIDMAHQLARELNVALEFVLIDRKNIAEALNTGLCDIVMTGLAVTTAKLPTIAFSEAYLDATFAFIVEDYLHDKFNSRASISNFQELKIGILNEPYFIEKIKTYLPHAHLVFLESPRDFFTKDGNDLDAFVFSAEAGSAWTLIYSLYAVAFPYPDIIKIPIAYAVPVKDYEMVNFINSWVSLKKKDKTIDKLCNYWILGKKETRNNPRWSVLHNVLELVE